MKKSTLQNEALELKEQGYDLSEIAVELGISETKVKEWLGDEPEKMTEETKNSRRKQEGKLRAMGKLKAQYDELFADYAENLHIEEVELETAQGFVEDVRKLEFQFRNVARDFGLNHENSEHWQALKTWIGELKDKIKEAIADADDLDDCVFELEFDEDFLENLDGLRFELVSFEEE